MKFVFISAEKAWAPVSALCRVLGVTRSGYYAWQQREPSEQAIDDQKLALELEAARRVCISLPRSGGVDPTAALEKQGGEPSVMTVADTLASTKKSLEVLKSMPDGETAVCDRALADLAVADNRPIPVLLSAGLGAAPLDELNAALDAVDRTSGTARVLAQVAAEGRLSAESLRVLARAIVTGVGVPETGVLGDAIGALEAAVVDTPQPTLRPDAIVAFLSEKYTVDEGGVATLRSVVLPSPWIAELNGGLPDVSFKTNNVLVVGDATVGYSAQSLGFSLRGGIDYADLLTSSGENESDHAFGSLDGWWLSGNASSPLRLEGRFVGGVDYYDTTLCPSSGGCNTTVMNPTTPVWIDYDSLLIRATALAGLRWKTDVLALEALPTNSGTSTVPVFGVGIVRGGM